MAESPQAFNAANAAPILPNIAAAVGSSGATSLDTLANSITDEVIADLQAGLAVFTAMKDQVGMNAYQAVLTELQAIQSAIAGATNLPKVHVATDAAILRTLVNAVQPNSPVANAVAPLAIAFGQSVLTVVNSIVTGAAIKVATAGLL